VLRMATMGGGGKVSDAGGGEKRSDQIWVERERERERERELQRTAMVVVW
ncbi:hypothetical protein A2U01_0088485, partial [Trifolium medium]|nr:hypothetical protein [Trifolium medium]